MPVLATLMGENSPATSFSVGKPEARVVNWGWPRVAQGSAAGVRRQAVVMPARLCSVRLAAPPGALQGTVGTPGGDLTAQPGPPLPPSLLQGHRFPFYVRRKLTACLQEQLGLVPSAVAPPPTGCTILAVSWELGANGSTLAPAQELWGALGLCGWRWGLQRAHCSRACFLSQSGRLGRALPGEGGSPVPSERDASRRLHGGQCPACPAVLFLWRLHPQGT